MEEANKLIDLLGLQPHPEGGYYREVYRSNDSGSFERFSGARVSSTFIYFLLKSGDVSKFHRIASDEIWHFYAGTPVKLVALQKGAPEKEWVLGPLVEGDVRSALVIPYGTWFGAYLEDVVGYSLVGCTVSPGFEFCDFEMGNREVLVEAYPQSKAIIEKLT